MKKLTWTSSQFNLNISIHNCAIRNVFSCRQAIYFYVFTLFTTNCKREEIEI